MEQILAHPQLFSNVGIASVLLLFIVYLINSHKEREKFWSEKFENSYKDLKTQLENTKNKTDMSYELFSQTIKTYNENAKAYRDEIFERIDSIKKCCQGRD